MSFMNFFARGSDGTNLEVGRLLWAASVLAGVIYSGVHMVLHGAYDPISYGTGLGALLAGGGAGIGMKDMANKGTPVAGTVTQTTTTEVGG